MLMLCDLRQKTSKPGLQSWSQDQSWGQSELTILAGVSKILPTLTQSHRILPVSRRLFGRNSYPSSQKHCKTGRKEECKCRDKVEALFGDKLWSEKMA